MSRYYLIGNSHHMKVLSECNLVNTRKDGKWSYYSLNCETLTSYREFIGELVCSKKYVAKNQLKVGAVANDLGFYTESGSWNAMVE